MLQSSDPLANTEAAFRSTRMRNFAWQYNLIASKETKAVFFKHTSLQLFMKINGFYLIWLINVKFSNNVAEIVVYKEINNLVL